jgi:hypothetical protein
VHSPKRAGALQPGVVSTTPWTRGSGEPAGNIVTCMDRHGDRLTLEYRTRAYRATEWTPRAIHVWLDSTPCHSGGERVWFACPGCQSRRAVLFSAGGVFRCRRCHGLAYESTREDAIERANQRIVTLQRKLQGPPDCTPWHIPPKPPRMHWRTYERLAGQLHDTIRRREALFGARFEELMQRPDGILACADSWSV